MKKIKQAFGPLKKGTIRIIISYRETGTQTAFEGVFNPDRNIEDIRLILRRKAPLPKPEPAIVVSS